MKLVSAEFDFTKNDLETVKDCLYELSAYYNADFNGDNGVEYLEECAKDKGFENNLEYYFELFIRYYDVPPIYDHSDKYSKLIEVMLSEMARGCRKYEFDYSITKEQIIIALYIEWD